VRLFIGIPWQDSGSDHRTESFDAVMRHLALIFPGVDIATHASGHTPFNLAACRNGLASEAFHGGYDVMLLCDADLVLDPHAAHAAVLAALEDSQLGKPRMHLPFDILRALTPGGRRMVLDGADPDEAPAIDEFDWSVGGAIVCRPEVWWSVGGQDERFRGWGGEDTAFSCVASTLLGGLVRHIGAANHLWHPITVDQTSPEYIANFALLGRYGEAKGDSDAIWALINEHTKERTRP